jgi:alkanesulfonate monooxygenase SsuD/methylene tetrahydromethanopterin reductase-like flavin-dependent oxidoreductase (luciferase family)
MSSESQERRQVAEQRPWAGLGVALPSVDAFGHGSPVVEVARAAEDAGLDHVWAPDHLVFHRPILETTMTLACVAGATERIRLGTAILNPALRPVVWLAKQLSTLDRLAPGRLLLGVGLGGEYEPEFRAAGVELKTRSRRLDEALELLPRLLRGEQVTHSGAFDVDCDGLAPTAHEMPPVLVGGRGDAAIRRTAQRGDAWLPMWLDPADIAAARSRLDEAAGVAGRPAPGIALVAFVNVCDDSATGHEQAAELVRRQYGMPYERVRRWTLVGSASEIAERMSEYVEAGVEGFSLACAHPQPIEQIEPLSETRALLARSVAVP